MGNSIEGLANAKLWGEESGENLVHESRRGKCDPMRKGDLAEEIRVCLCWEVLVTCWIVLRGGRAGNWSQNLKGRDQMSCCWRSRSTFRL